MSGYFAQTFEMSPRKAAAAPYGFAIRHIGPEVLKVKRETEYMVEFWMDRVRWSSNYAKRMALGANYGGPIPPLGIEPAFKTKRMVRREKKFVCIGGPYAGARKSETQLQQNLSGHGYRGFNRSKGGRMQVATTNGPRYRRDPRNRTADTKVWVHCSLVP